MITVDAPLDMVPMFVRGGAIIPVGPSLNYIGEKPADPITFNIYPDDKGSASARLYEDDGVSPAYKTGTFRRTTVSARRAARGFIVSVGAAEGTYNPGPRKFNFVLMPEGKISTVTDDGKARQVGIN